MNYRKVVLSLACLFLLGAFAHLPAQTRIRFAKGRTSSTQSGTLLGGGVKQYLLGARAGQELSGNVSSTNGCVKFTEGSTSLNFTTESGDNLISITNYCKGKTAFTLTVSINY